MRTSAFFGEKLRIFQFMMRPHGQGEGSNQYGHLPYKGEGVNFSRFCADVFYGWTLRRNTMSIVISF